MRQRTTILAIDDEPAVRDLLRSVLEDEEFRVVLAADGEEGLALITKERPDLILLDVRMPRKDGWSVLEEVQRTSRTPVIMLTAVEDVSLKAWALDAGGADGYVVKPFEIEELVARIRAVLRRRP